MKPKLKERAAEWAKSVPQSVWSPVSYVGLAGMLFVAITVSSGSEVIPPIYAALSSTTEQDPMALVLAVTVLSIYVSVLGLSLLAVLASVALLQKSRAGWVLIASFATSIILGSYEHKALLSGHWFGFSAWAALQCGSILHPNAVNFGGFRQSQDVVPYLAIAVVSGALLFTYSEVIELFNMVDDLQKYFRPNG